MSLKPIDAILWRSYKTSTSDAIWGARKNQYYLDMPAGNYEEFFGESAETTVDPQGNTVYRIWLEPYEGSTPTDRYPLEFKKLRPDTARKGSWNINGQHSGQGYELWRGGRGPTAPYQDLPSADRESNYLVLIRDSDGLFHGRWIRPDELASMPQSIRMIIQSKAAGWEKISS